MRPTNPCLVCLDHVPGCACMKKEVFLECMSTMDDKGEYAVLRCGEPVDYDENRTMCVEVHFNPNVQTVYGAFRDAMLACLDEERIHAPEEIIGQLAERMKVAIDALNQVEKCVQDYGKIVDMLEVQ